MAFSPYEYARGRITLPKSVHMSHIEMMIHTSILSGILSPFLSRIDKLIKRKKGMKRRYEQGKKMMHEGCKMNEKMKLKQKIKHLKNNML